MAPFSAALTAFLLLIVALTELSKRDYKRPLHGHLRSYWDLIKYESTTKQCCDTKLQQVCITKNDQVCTDVLELNCDVVAWGECLSTPTSIESTKCSVHDFAHQKCEETRTSVKHTKKVPERKEVTKNNCVTDWEVDENGNKVWAGTETCTPVIWEECDIVEKTVDFPTVRTECGVDSQIKWVDFVDTTRNIAGLESKCQVKKAVNCEHVVVNKCAPVVWEECKMEPREECRSVIIHTPNQEKIHQKKCLTGDQADPEFKAGIVYPGKEFSEISSPNGEYSCEMQPDGRFVVTTRDGKIVWSTETLGTGLQFEFRVDRTLCVHDQHGTLVWSAGTFGEDADRLVLENDGFLVLYSKTGAVLWTSQPHKLLRGQMIKAGYSMVSPHGLYTLTMQNDGNLVLYSTHGTETWTVGVEGL